MRNRKRAKLKAQTGRLVGTKRYSYKLINLPVELLRHILSFCNAKEIVAMEQVNKLFFLVILLMDVKTLTLQERFNSLITKISNDQLWLYTNYSDDGYYFIFEKKFDRIQHYLKNIEANLGESISHFRVINFISTLESISQKYDIHRDFVKNNLLISAKEMRLRFIIIEMAIASVGYNIAFQFDFNLIYFLALFCVLAVPFWKYLVSEIEGDEMLKSQLYKLRFELKDKLLSFEYASYEFDAIQRYGQFAKKHINVVESNNNKIHSLVAKTN